MTERKIAYLTGSRADFGLMTPVLKEIDQSDKLKLILYASGMHLMEEFGYSINEVKRLFPQVQIVDATYQTDDKKSTAFFVSDLLSKLVKKFDLDKPDITLTLGDRAEMLMVAVASLYMGIITAQVHGGEKTFTVDEITRHAITKLSHLHFPATKESAERIEKMGEDSWRIFTVGAPALDKILRMNLPSKSELLDYLNLKEEDKIILVTQHPVSGEEDEAAEQMKITLDAIRNFGLATVIIYPNADSGGRRMIDVLKAEKAENSNVHLFKNIPHELFLALERESVVWLGNSSGALIESSSFGIPVVNIGTRQLGRQRGDNVIDTDYNREEITNAVEKSLYDCVYISKLKSIKNPWGDGNASRRIVSVLENVELTQRLLCKQISY